MGCCLSKREDRNDYDLLTSDDIVGDVDGGLLSEQLQEFGFFRRATTMFRGRKSTVVGRRPTVARKTTALGLSTTCPATWPSWSSAKSSRSPSSSRGCRT